MLGAARPVSFLDGLQPCVEHQDLRTPPSRDVQPLAEDAGPLAGSAVDSSTLCLTPLSSGLVSATLPRKAISPAQVAGAPEWVAFHDLLTEHDMVELALYRWVEGGQIIDHGLHSSQRPPTLAIDQFVFDSRYDEASRTAAASLRPDYGSRRFVLVVVARRSRRATIAAQRVSTRASRRVRSSEDDLTGRVDADGDVAPVEDLAELAEWCRMIPDQLGPGRRRIVVAHSNIVTRTAR